MKVRVSIDLFKYYITPLCVCIHAVAYNLKTSTTTMRQQTHLQYDYLLYFIHPLMVIYHEWNSYIYLNTNMNSKV